jgi:hypothetical protein
MRSCHLSRALRGSGLSLRAIAKQLDTEDIFKRTDRPWKRGPCLADSRSFVKTQTPHLYWWWLSYATERDFLGVVIVRAETLVHATLRVADDLHINPGGNVEATMLKRDLEVDSAFADRLLTRSETEFVNAYLAANALPLPV